MLATVGKVLAFLLPLLFGPKGEGATKVQGAFNSILSSGAVGAAVLWILGPGRDWEITLNALELSGVVLGAVVLIEWARRSDPP